MDSRAAVRRARSLLASGVPPREAAVTLMREGVRRRAAWRLAAGLSQHDAAAKFNEVVGDDRSAVTATRISEWENWGERQKDYARRPNFAQLTVLGAMYGTSARALVDDLEMSRFPVAERASLRSAAPHGNSALMGRHAPAALPIETSRSDDDPNAPLGLLLQRAYEQSIAGLKAAQSSEIGTLAMNDAFEQVRGIAREHLYVNSVDLLPETLRLQQQLQVMAQQHTRVDQKRDLHVMSSIVTLLIADTTTSAGEMELAMRQAGVAYEYASLAGHAELQFWARGIMQASILNWFEKPGRALDLLRQETVAAGTAASQMQVWNSEALYSARLTDQQGAVAALEASQTAATAPSFLQDEIGGMFAYPVAKQAQVAAMTYLELGDYEQAADAARLSLSEYQKSGLPQRAFGNEAAARIDLGHALLGKGEIEESLNALTPVLTLPLERRQYWIVKRAERLRSSALAMGKRLGSRARHATDALGDFASDSVRAEYDTALSAYNWKVDDE